MFGNHVDLTPLFPYLNEFLVVLLSGLVGIATMWLRNFLRAHAAFLGVQTDKALADGFDRALQNGVNIALQQADRFEKDHATVDFPGGFKGWVAARAAQYAVDHSPDYVANFFGSANADQAMVDAANKALSKIPLPGGVVGAVPAPGAVETAPLPPVGK